MSRARRSLSAEHVRRALLAFVASERGAARGLGGAMFPTLAEPAAWEAAHDADLCRDLAASANDVDEIGETWVTAPLEHDVAEHAAFVLLLRLPAWAKAKRGEDAALMKAITDRAFLHTFLTGAWGLLERLLADRAAAPRPARRRRR